MERDKRISKFTSHARTFGHSNVPYGFEVRSDLDLNERRTSNPGTLDHQADLLTLLLSKRPIGFSIRARLFADVFLVSRRLNAT
jgi:hypothetical protein